MDHTNDLAAITVFTVFAVAAAREAGMPVRFAGGLVLLIGCALGAALIERSVAGALAGAIAAMGGSGGYSLVKTQVESTQKRKRAS